MRKPLLIYTFEQEDQEDLNRTNTLRTLRWVSIAICLTVALFSCTAHASTDIDLGIIAQIESSGNPNAYNSHSGAIGLCQITPIVLKEYDLTYNQRHTKEMLFNEQFNKDVADWYMNFKIPAYLRHYKLADNTKNRLWAYNAGIGKVRKGIMPQETKNYIAKYNRLESAK